MVSLIQSLRPLSAPVFQVLLAVDVKTFALWAVSKGHTKSQEL